MNDKLYSRRFVLKMMFGGLGALGVVGTTKLVLPENKEKVQNASISLQVTAQPVRRQV